MAEIGDREQRHARGVEPLDEFEAAGHGTGDRFVEARRISVDQRRMTGEPGLEFGDHLGERAPGVVLKMPLRRDDVRHEPFELVPIVDQLGEQMAQIPVEQDAAYIEDHALANRSEEHTSELQSLMRISYAVFCLKKKNLITLHT